MRHSKLGVHLVLCGVSCVHWQAPTFKLVGFSLRGRVLCHLPPGSKPAMRAVAGATLTLKPSAKAAASACAVAAALRTDELGEYTLGVTSCMLGAQRQLKGADGTAYSIVARAPHVRFAAALSLELSPALLQLPPILVESFHVCGSVRVAAQDLVTLNGVQTALANAVSHIALQRLDVAGTGKEQSGIAEQTTAVDEDGAFCFWAAPGRVTLRVVASASASSKGQGAPLFSPAAIALQLDGPVSPSSRVS